MILSVTPRLTDEAEENEEIKEKEIILPGRRGLRVSSSSDYVTELR